MNTRKKQLPVGIENFADIRTNDYYYVDKTDMIVELLNNLGMVNLFTRPRRFGKSLTMSMLKHFFEVDCDQTLFDGLAVSQETELCQKYMGQFPVISVSLKGAYGDDFKTARSMMCEIIGAEAMRFQFLLESDHLTEIDKIKYRQLINLDLTGQERFLMPDTVLYSSLKSLSALLQKHYGKKVILLIDEYDVPLAKANDKGYYEQMITLIRLLFEHALKTNDSLQFAVLTGCLRISKESIFTGLNNPRIHSITGVVFKKHFGFTDEEVRQMLDYYDLLDIYETVRTWYDGYRFGDVEVYCPWDVINYIADRRYDPLLEPQNYWANTSGNDIIRHFLEMAKAATRREIEMLISGEGVTKQIREELTYRDLYSSIDNLWSVLLTTGYLTIQGRVSQKRAHLVIPNEEIRDLFLTQIMEWMQEVARADGDLLNRFCEAFKNRDPESAQQIFMQYLGDTISIRDTAVRNDLKENFYHGVLLGLLSYKDEWYVTSNRESGDGYSDILVEIDKEKIGIVIEVKYAHGGDLAASCKEALEQIESMDYAAILRQDGMQTILKYGIACHVKECGIQISSELIAGR